MSRKFSILVAFCVVLFGAILAGYWDMLDSERLRSVRDQASRSVAELTGTRSDSSGAAPEDLVSPPISHSTPMTPGQPAPSDSAAVKSGTSAADAPVQGEAGNPGPMGGKEPPSREASLQPGTAQTAPPSLTPAPATGLPTFDILRVEPDGSAVLAGRAAPNADVRIVDGDKTIGSAKASPGGDFAIVLDDRLPAGDHQIRIEAGQTDGTRTISQETAIVSVPRPGEPGELLAMVETPNRPSRIITLPNADPGVGGSGATAGQVAEAPPKDGTSSDQQQTASVSPMPGANNSSASSPAPAAAQPAAGPPSPFAVEAVEIENGTVYIAGRAPGTAPVRVYVDNKLIGEDRARSNGRFLVTAKVPLAVGDHRIRADMIKAGGVVASRVEVPFAKPEGDAMSAIASNDADDRGDQASPAGRLINDTARPADGAAAGAVPPSGAAAGAARSAGTAVPGADARPQTETLAGPDVAASGPSPTTGFAPADADIGNELTAAEDGSDVATFRQPALEGVRSRVLIRRGDTLWRISRQAYGFGRRYTVIYVANGDQIRNPNRIYPGQVFRLPKGETPGGQEGPTAVR